MGKKENQPMMLVRGRLQRRGQITPGGRHGLSDADRERMEEISARLEARHQRMTAGFRKNKNGK